MGFLLVFWLAIRHSLFVLVIDGDVSPLPPASKHQQFPFQEAIWVKQVAAMARISPLISLSRGYF